MNKKVLNATKCSYKGVDLRSKLELFAYKQLESAKLDFEYEKHKFTLIEKFECEVPVHAPIESGKKKGVFELSTPKIQAMTYTPDFIVHTTKGDYVIEVKGQPNDLWSTKLKLFKMVLNDQKHIYKGMFVLKNQTQIIETIKYLRTL